MNKKILFTLALVLLSIVEVSAKLTPEEVQAAIDKFVNGSTMRHASAGVAVSRISDGEVLGSHFLDRSVITASTMKTVTSATALRVLGPDFRYETRVWLDGELKKDKFVGDIIIEGAGDPTLGSVHFPNQPDIVKEIIAALQALGIKKVEGQILTDESLYPFPGPSVEWNVEDLAWGYGAGVYPLNFLDNHVQATFTCKNGELSPITITPPVPGLGIVNHMTVGKEDDCQVLLDLGNPAVVFYGTVNENDYKFTISHNLPGALLADSVSRTLKSSGLKYKAKDKRHAANKTLLLTHRSPRLDEIIRSLLDRSDNMFTEGLLRTIAVHEGLRGTASNGASVVKRLWAHDGLDTDALYMYDGSGLSRADRNSPHFFLDMLRYMAQHDCEGVYLYQLMPKAGKRIGKLLPQTRLANDIVLKSGSMGNVQCFVGYYPASKPEYCFSLLVNYWNGSRADLRDEMDRMLISIFGE